MHFIQLNIFLSIEFFLDEVWHNFLEHKKESILTARIIKQYENYICNKEYAEIVTKIINEEYDFSIPRKVAINKVGKNKKRIVYLYNKKETYILKILVF